jgi:nucleoside-diphosphate-sugar epimerase
VTTLIAGCGDLGTRTGLLLAARGEPVIGLKRRGELPAPLVTVHADLRAPASLTALPGDIDTLIFAAAPDERSEAAYRALFVDGLQQLVAVLEPVLRRVVFVSSTAVYGDHGGEVVDESTPAHPARFNGAVLLDAERWLAAQSVTTTSLRLGGIYGPGREQLISRVAAGDLRCTPGAWTNRIHVEDAARALVHVLDLATPADCYVVVDEAPALECEVVAWLARQLGVTATSTIGDVSPSRAGGNRRVSSARLAASGFRWNYPTFQFGYSALIAARTRGTGFR